MFHFCSCVCGQCNPFSHFSSKQATSKYRTCAHFILCSYILKYFNFAWNWSLQMLLKEWKWDTCCIDSLYLWERSHEISHPYPFCLHNFVFWVSDFRHWLEDMAHGCVKIKSLMSLNKIPNVTDFIKLFK